MAKTRELRAEGRGDEEIILALGLREKAEFMQDRAYLRPLFGFVTSRKAADEKTNIALAYQYRAAESRAGADRQQRSLSDF